MRIADLRERWIRLVRSSGRFRFASTSTAFRESGRLDINRVAVAERSDATELDAGQAPVAWGILPQPPMQDLIKQKALAQTHPESRKAI